MKNFPKRSLNIVRVKKGGLFVLPFLPPFFLPVIYKHQLVKKVMENFTTQEMWDKIFQGIEAINNNIKESIEIENKIEVKEDQKDYRKVLK